MAFLAPVGAFLAANAGTISTVLTVSSAAVEGINSIQQGNYQAAVAKNNAVIAEQNAAAEALAAQREQLRSDKDYAARYAEQVAMAGASGLDLNSSSFVRGRMLTRRTGRQASRDINDAGRVRAQGFQQETANFRAEGSAAKRQGIFGAVGAGLGAASSIMGSSLIGPRRDNRNGGRRPTQRPSWYGNG